jgi:hypothetical protein
MSDDSSARWALPLLQPGQAQKEMVHNEAIAGFDLIVQAVALAILDAPPSAPESGQSWIVGADPEGDWLGKTDLLAGWTEGGWRFAVPLEGMAIWLISEGLTARFVSGAWTLGEETAANLSIGGVQVVGERQPAIADPLGGSAIDAESRATLIDILAALRAHGLIEN